MTNHVGYLYGVNEAGKTAIAPSWLDAPIQFNTDSEGWLASGLLQATRTNTQPISAEPTEHANGKKMPSFVDDFYNRILIEPSYVDVGNLVSDQFRVISVFNGYFETKTLEELLVSGGDGLTVNGPTLPHTWGPLETIEFQLTILSEGPPQIDALLSFDWTGTVDDLIVQVVGARIVSLPYQACVPWGEVLEWATDVITSNDGSEQRVRLRKAPRQTFMANYPIPANEMARAENIAYGWLARKWAVPVWSQTQPVTNLISGDTVIACDSANYDFREGGLVLIWSSATVNEVIEIDSVDVNQLVLARGMGNSYPVAIICPVLNGRVAGNIKRKTNGYTAMLALAYEITENVDIASDVPDQYLGYDLYWNEQLLGDSNTLEDDLNRRVDVVDYETGKVDFYSPWLYTRPGRSFNFVNEGAEECWTFRKFLHRRAGKLRPFWIPTFESNLRLEMTGTVTSTLRVTSDDYRGLGDDRNHIGILLQDGTWHARAITGTSLDDSTHINVGIDSPISVDASEIKIISYLGLKRFDTDRVEVSWIGNSVNTAAVRMLEIKP